jgi:hypothetical protein
MRNVMLVKCKCLNASIERDEQKTQYLIRDIEKRSIITDWKKFESEERDATRVPGSWFWFLV